MVRESTFLIIHRCKMHEKLNAGALKNARSTQTMMMMMMMVIIMMIVIFFKLHPCCSLQLVFFRHERSKASMRDEVRELRLEREQKKRKKKKKSQCGASEPNGLNDAEEICDLAEQRRRENTNQRGRGFGGRAPGSQ